MKSLISRIVGMFLAFSLGGAAIGYLVYVFEELSTGSQLTPLALVAAAAGAAVFGTIILGPVGKSIAKLLDGDSTADENLRSTVLDIEDRLGELSVDQQRVAELEDRLEFAERLLSERNGVGIEGGSK